MGIVGQKAAVGPPGLVKPMTNIKRLLGNWGPVVLLTLGTLWLIQGTLAHTGSHGVFVLGADYDAGLVKAGIVVTHNIRLTDLSSQPVLLDAQAGCGCTVVDVPSQTLAPLHTEDVKVEVDTNGMSQGTQKRWVMLAMRSGRKTWQKTAVVSCQLLSIIKTPEQRK